MRVSRAQAEANRERVVEVASEAFRQKGFDGASIAELMQAAGLTHGGFYGNFASKGDLEVEASRHAFAETLQRAEAATAGADDPLAALVAFYLNPAHRDHQADGCALAALTADAARGNAELRNTFEAGIRNYLKHIEALPGGGDAAARHRQAIATLATLVGALQLARAVADPGLSAEILASASAALLAGRPAA